MCVCAAAAVDGRRVGPSPAAAVTAPAARDTLGTSGAIIRRADLGPHRRAVSCTVRSDVIVRGNVRRVYTIDDCTSLLDSWKIRE